MRCMAKLVKRSLAYRIKMKVNKNSILLMVNKSHSF
jgi:hypothetical protein